MELANGPYDWMEKANCKDLPPEIMIPSRGEPDAIEIARSVCKECVVVEECLQFALDNHITIGFFGNTSGRERRQMFHDRKKK